MYTLMSSSRVSSFDRRHISLGEEGHTNMQISIKRILKFCDPQFPSSACNIKTSLLFVFWKVMTEELSLKYV